MAKRKTSNTKARELMEHADKPSMGPAIGPKPHAALSRVATVAPSVAKPKELCYKVSSPKADGFWRIGRRFTRTAVILKASELTSEEAKVLEDGCTYLFIEKITQ